MKSYILKTIFCTAMVCTVTLPVQGQGREGRPPGGDPAPPRAGTYTTVSGTISQLNYDRDAEVEGFLLNKNTIVHLPPRAAARIAPSLHAGDSVQVAGFAGTSPLGFQRVEVQSLQDRTSGKSFNIPRPGPSAPYSGSGKIQQLNYGGDGAVNGLLLSDGTLVSVPPFNGSNPTSLQAGATVSYSGYARRTMNDRTVVDAQNLTINGQQLALAIPAGPRGPRGVNPPPPPPPPAMRTPVPQGPVPQSRIAEPPPPPPPAAPIQ